MTDKLKPCPFCGGKAIFTSDFSESYNYVMCKDCYCRTQVFATKTTPIKIWNTRKPMDKIVEELEEENITAADAACIFDGDFVNGVVKGIKEGIETAIAIVKGVQNE